MKWHCMAHTVCGSVMKWHCMAHTVCGSVPPLHHGKGIALDVEQKTCTVCGVFCHSQCCKRNIDGENKGIP